MQVTEMACTGFIGITYPDGTKREEQLPASPKGEGEFPTGIHLDDAGDVFVVGKLYGGRSQPDDGVVYRREASTGETAIVFTHPGRTFGSVTGRGCGELYVGAIGGIAVCVDGEWQFIELPEYAMLWEVFRDGDDLIAQSFNGLVAKELRGGSTIQTYPRPQPMPRANRITMRGVTYSAFDRTVEVGPHLLSEQETSTLRGEMNELGRALANRSARVRKLS